MSISSIDELLMGGSSAQQPMPIEEKLQTEPEPVEEMEQDEPNYEDDESLSQPLSDDKDSDKQESNDDADLDEEPDRNSEEVDEYGNKKERMSKGMKERLDRKEKQYQREIDQREQEINDLRAKLAQQGASNEVQKAAKDFEYDPNEAGDWQQQLRQFVKQTVNSMTQEKQESEVRARDAQAQAQFESKFKQGMNQFEDFRDVISSLPCEISDPMTLATRAMENPAAFIYAAAKRHPQELERISKIRDPYGQMMEMGKLEERMRRNKPTTKAPRPLGRAPEDATTNVPKKKVDQSGDDLLAKADAKRLTTVKTRLRSNR